MYSLVSTAHHRTQLITFGKRSPKSLCRSHNSNWQSVFLLSVALVNGWVIKKITSSMYFRWSKKFHPILHSYIMFYATREKYFSSEIFKNFIHFPTSLCCLACNLKLNSFKCCVISVKDVRQARESDSCILFCTSVLGFTIFF